MNLRDGEGSAADLWRILMGEEGLDSGPGTRGVTLVGAEREECLWPCVKDHGLRLVWDKRENRMTMQILPNRKLVLDDGA